MTKSKKEFKPMLATQVDDLTLIKYPVYASYKLDGIRCIIKDGVALSRSLKPIPNKHIQKWASDNFLALECLDGEFIVGSPTDADVFRNTTSFVMSHDKVGSFRFFAFDLVIGGTAQQRNVELHNRSTGSNVVVLEQFIIHNEQELEVFRQKAIKEGYEGVMVKAITGEYKFGRSSVKEGLLLKMKLFVDAEFEIVGYECKYHNSNEATTNELGRTARSTTKAGMIALDTLGVLYLKTIEGTEFGCGSGYDDATRDSLWAIRETLKGKLATVKYFDIGGYDVPRFPVFKGIRNPLDIS